jgi:integrase
MAKRKRLRSAYAGCSAVNHNGVLRLCWRVPGTTKRQTWSTGEPYNAATLEKWEPARKAVGAMRAQGIDPLLHLQKQKPEVKPKADAVTIRSYFPAWLDSKDVRPALLRDYRQHFTAYVSPDLIADTPLSEMRPSDISGFQARLRRRQSRRGTPLSEKTVQNVIAGTLRAMLRDAAADDHIKRDVFVGLTWKHWEIPPADPLTGEEWDAVDHWFQKRTYHHHLSRKPHPAYYAFVFMLRWHGVRPSEAAGLSWDDVDVNQGVAYVNKSFVLGSLGEPKTRSARRSIELHPAMLSLLKSLRPLKPKPGEIVFPNLEGRRIRSETFSEIWTDCLQSCRIRHRGIYCLKDTFVSETLKTAEASGEVQRLTAWLVRQTGVRLDTLKQHYARWFPRDTAAIHATYALLDPDFCHPIVTPREKKSA